MLNAIWWPSPWCPGFFPTSRRRAKEPTGECGMVGASVEMCAELFREIVVQPAARLRDTEISEDFRWSNYMITVSKLCLFFLASVDLGFSLLFF